MKKIYFLFVSGLLFFAACNNKKANQPDNDKTSSKIPQNTDYLVTLEGIGLIKTAMTQEEVEKLLNKKVPLTNPTDSVSGSWEDSAVIKFKEADVTLAFVRTYMKEDSFYMRVTGIKTSSPLCKTQNGIGIGASKQQIIDAFENYLLIMSPDYEDTTYTTRSKTRYSIKIREDWEGKELVFYLKDNKVFSMEVTSFHDDSE